GGHLPELARELQQVLAQRYVDFGLLRLCRQLAGLLLEPRDYLLVHFRREHRSNFQRKYLSMAPTKLEDRKWRSIILSTSILDPSSILDFLDPPGRPSRHASWLWG